MCQENDLHLGGGWAFFLHKCLTGGRFQSTVSRTPVETLGGGGGGITGLLEHKESHLTELYLKFNRGSYRTS